jgi:DNA-binding response OmpR family regulator
MQASILVVESHHDLCSAIVAAVNRQNLACDSVRSGKAALVRLREHNYDCILVDDDEATAAADLLNDLTIHPHSPKLVLLTEFDRTDNVAFLRKPFDSKQLIAKIIG